MKFNILLRVYSRDVHELRGLSQGEVSFLGQGDEHLEPTGRDFAERRLDGLCVGEQHLIAEHSAVEGAFDVLKVRGELYEDTVL